MRHEGILSLRLPRDLLDAIEQERRHVSRTAGIDIKTSQVVRSILERNLRRWRRRDKQQRSSAA